VYLCVLVAICVWLYITAMQTFSCASNPITEDPDLFWIYVRYGPDTLVIQKSTHGMIRGSVLAVKIKGDSVQKSRHFTWVFVYWSISISVSYFIVSCECLYYSAHEHAHFIDIRTRVVIFWDWNVCGRLPTWC